MCINIDTVIYIYNIDNTNTVIVSKSEMRVQTKMSYLEFQT